ncbi:MAG TPA: TonB-dependent receptor [Gemmatimonadaceae bacterium]|nr:TonB-dependent receptor [Gemmatimonadaceae bacterium]
MTTNMLNRVRLVAARLIAAVATVMLARIAHAQTTQNDSVVTLSTMRVVAERADQVRVQTMQRLTLPVTASITASRAKQTVNLVDPEDAVKYLPSLFLRKRNYGDTQATMATRVWGLSSSARSLVFADGVPISALIANNNTIGGPRWGLVSPEEISRIDLMYGPFSAAYAGNSMGAVMEITTRQADRLEGSIEQAQALQRFSLYGTQRTFGTSQTNATLGDRLGKFSFWAGGSHQSSDAQPLTYVTSGSIPNGTNGGYADQNKLGATANVLGASGLLRTEMTNAKVKLAYDITPTLRGAYTLGVWRNDASSGVDTYLDADGGQPTFAGQTGFATGFYDLVQQHVARSLSLRSDTRRDWDFEAIGSWYRFDKDQQRLPTAASTTDTSFGSAGRVAVLDGTGWSSVDLKGAWHKGGLKATNTLTFGVHEDDYRLLNPTYNTSDWRSGDFTTVATEGNGKTRTRALWAQDTWMLTPALTLTLGGRYESWRAFDGFNANGSTSVAQPVVTASRFSPKAVLAWDLTPDWRLTTSVAKAYRFATASELYQLVSTGATFTSPDPSLRPDNDLSAEVRIARTFDHGAAQVSLFQDDIHDAIISQFLPLAPNSPTLYSYISNVDHVRARGVEATVAESDVMVHGIDLSASATYLDARTLALSGRANATAPEGSAVGKFLPNIPKWRATFVGVYRPATRLALSLAGRYSSKLYTTLDNADVHPNTYQGFSEWFVMDTKANYRLDDHWSAAVGVDNLLNRKYFLFHPFPQRTVVASAKFGF